MDEIKRCPICGEKATTIYGLDYDDWWWEHSCSDKDKTFGVNISGNTSHETEEGAIAEWNDFCKIIEEFGREWLNKVRAIGYRNGYEYGYEVGYEKGWQANN